MKVKLNIFFAVIFVLSVVALVFVAQQLGENIRQYEVRREIAFNPIRDISDIERQREIRPYVFLVVKSSIALSAVTLIMLTDVAACVYFNLADIRTLSHISAQQLKEQRRQRKEERLQKALDKAHAKVEKLESEQKKDG